MRYLLFPLLLLFATACTQLEVEPRSTESAEVFFAEEGSYRAYLARIYAGLAVTGQQGPAGDPDLQNIDEGFSSYQTSTFMAGRATTSSFVPCTVDSFSKLLRSTNFCAKAPSPN